MNIKKEIKIGIISSIIGSVIILCLQPFLAFVWSLVKEVSANSYSGYINGIYSQAAVGLNEQFSFIILVIIISAFIAVIIGIFIQTKAMSSRLMSLQNKIEKSETSVEKENQVLLLRAKSQRVARTVKYLTVFEYIFIPISMIYIMVFVFGLFVVMQLNASFNQRLTAISPYINDLTEREIKSEWALMKTEEDFRKIDSQIEILAHNAKIVLPENLLK